MIVLLSFALLAGVLTILSPCILPVVPLVLGSAAGGGRARPVGIVLGLALSFTLFTVVLAAALAALGLTTSVLRVLAVLVLAAVGATLLVPPLGARLAAALAPLARLGSRGAPGGSGSGLGGGLALGALLGLVWAPCAGPIMATVIALATTGGVAPATAAITLAYALGAALPLLALAYGGRALAQRTRTQLSGALVQRGLGALMLLTCLAILFNVDLQVQNAVAGALPADWQNRLYGVEATAPVQQELSALQQPTDPPVALAVPQAPTALPATAAPVAPTPPAPAAAPPATAMPPAATPTTAPPTPVPATPTAVVADGLPPPIAADLPANVPLDDLGPAPELTGITAWINSPPTTLKALRGQVVLVHFWTFACINCIHVQPYVKDWYARYKDAGFTILGVHTPELSYERDLGNVRDAVKQDGVLFPVAFDPQYATWNAYHNIYWPAFYFVDKQGHIRHTHFGEGDYAGSEAVIRELLRAPAQ